MKVKVKFKGLTLRGKIAHKTIKYKCPDFETASWKYDCIVNGVETSLDFTDTIEQQVDEWVLEQDKMDLIYDLDWHCIIDWDIMKAKKKKQTAIVLFKSKEEQLLNIARVLLKEDDNYFNFEAVYYSMKKSIKGLGLETQLHVVFNSMNTATKAAIVAYQHVGRIIKGDYTEEEQARYETLEEKVSPILAHRRKLRQNDND